MVNSDAGDANEMTEEIDVAFDDTSDALSSL